MIKCKRVSFCADTIDLCTREGEVKQLCCLQEENVAKLFTLRELCMAVRVQPQGALVLANTDIFTELLCTSADREPSQPHYTPILTEYANNEPFLCKKLAIATQ